MSDFSITCVCINQKATEKLRQGIIAGNPDMVKASISEGADINTKVWSRSRNIINACLT